MDNNISSACSKFYLLLSLLSILVFCSSGSFLFTAKHFLHRQHNKPYTQTHHRQILIQTTTQHDLTTQPPITTLPTTPVTNPVTTPVTNPVTTPSTIPVPPEFPTSPITAVPSANPTMMPPPITFPPAIQNPILPPVPVTTPVQNPVNTPVPVTNPVTTPVQNPVTTPVPVTNPVTTPSTTTNPSGTTAPAVGTTSGASGQSWCVAKSGAAVTAIQTALDYACGLGGADCSAIQSGASCYNPNTLQNHASFAFNSYYQKNPVQTSCDFGGAAMITNVNPSSGSCIFPTGSSSSSSSPTMASPVTTTPVPTTESSSGAMPTGSGTPPTVLNASGPALGGGISGYGESPLGANISSASRPSNFQPFLGCIIIVTTIITGRTVLGN